jgi:hypothetical protein
MATSVCITDQDGNYIGKKGLEAQNGMRALILGSDY